MKPLNSYIYSKIFAPLFLYKKGAIAYTSISFATLITGFQSFLKLELFGFSMLLIILLFVLVFADSFTGIIASRHNGDKIESGKLMYSFYKILFAFLFFWLISELQNRLTGKIYILKSEYLTSFYRTIKEILDIINVAIFTLFCLREWISIGENIEKRFNKKPYIFGIVEKIFDLIETKLLKYLENKDICK